MYSFPNFELVKIVHCSKSSSNCCFLTCIQVFQETGKVFWYSHLLVNETEVNAFLEFSCFFYVPVDVGNLISGSSAFYKSSLYIWKFLVHVMLKTSLKHFEHYLVRRENEHICLIVWTFFGIALLWDWNENWPFPVLWPLLSVPNLLTGWVQHFHNIIF